MKNEYSMSSVESLIAALKDTDMYVRIEAVKAFGKIGDPRAVGPLIELIVDCSIGADARNKLTEYIVVALGRIGEPALAPLLAIVDDKKAGGFYRATAIMAIGNIGNPRAIDPLVTVLKNKELFCYEEAAIALGKIGGEAFEPLMAVYNNSNSDLDLRTSVLKALGEMKDARVRDVLLTAIRDENEHIRHYAAESLGKLKYPEFTEPLISLLKDKERWVRVAAAEALGKIGNINAVEPLIFAVKDPCERVRMAIIEALGMIGDKRAIEPVKNALIDKWRMVRDAAREAMNKNNW